MWAPGSADARECCACQAYAPSLRSERRYSGTRAASTPNWPTLADADAVRDMFDASDGRIALIGEAGTGKTTTTITLFSELLSWTEINTKDKVPVFVRLSGWRAPLPWSSGWSTGSRSKLA